MADMLQILPWRDLPQPRRRIVSAGVVAAVIGVVAVLAGLYIEGDAGSAIGWTGIAALLVGAALASWAVLNLA